MLHYAGLTRFSNQFSHFFLILFRSSQPIPPKGGLRLWLRSQPAGRPSGWLAGRLTKLFLWCKLHPLFAMSYPQPVRVVDNSFSLVFFALTFASIWSRSPDRVFRYWKIFALARIPAAFEQLTVACYCLRHQVFCDGDVWPIEHSDQALALDDECRQARPHDSALCYGECLLCFPWPMF